jgi:peroxiredoxin
MKRIMLSAILTLLIIAPLHGVVAPWEIEEIMDKPAPEFMLQDLQGNNISLSDFKNKIILINFWATWCEPCKNEMPSLNKLFIKYRDRGFVVLGISIDRSKEPVIEFLKSIPLDFPVLLDSTVEISQKYKVYAYPTSFLIDRKGLIRAKFIGEEDWLAPEKTMLIEKYMNKR